MTNANQPMSDMDLALAIGLDILESGYVRPELRDALSDSEKRSHVIQDLVAFLEERLCSSIHLRDGEYLVPVDYSLSVDQAVQEARLKYSSVVIPGRGRWQMHSEFFGASQVSGNRVMSVKSFEYPIITGEAIHKIVESGYRPATHLEACAFVRAYPELYREFTIVALASYIRYDVFASLAAILYCRISDGARIFSVSSLVHGWDKAFRFLCVREEVQHGVREEVQHGGI